MRPLVCLQDVTCGYDTKIILRNLDLDINEGSFVGLVGPSGSGKTTLLRLIMGQVAASSGTVFVNGSKLANHAPSGIGYVPQVETVDWNFPVTVEQVVLMGRIRAMNWWPWPSALDRKLLAALLNRLGLADLAHSHIRELSGGQQQRVFLARALISNPKILLLDEPTSGVDVKTRNEILVLLSELNQQENITIVLTTHDLSLAATYLPLIICLNKTVLAYGKPADVLNDAVLSQTYNAPLKVINYEGQLLVADKKAISPTN